MDRGNLHGKALSARAGPGSVGIDKMEPLAVKPSAEVQGGSEQIEHAFSICNNLHPLVFKDLVSLFWAIVEGHFVGESGASASYDRHPDKPRIVFSFCLHQGIDLFKRCFRYMEHDLFRSCKVKLLRCAHFHLDEQPILLILRLKPHPL